MFRNITFAKGDNCMTEANERLITRVFCVYDASCQEMQ